jgi:glycosyltransferase involved in cell wall biosynthesis
MDVVVIGDGPMLSDVLRAAMRPGSRLISKGFLKHAEIADYMRSARVLLMPSIWYEGGLPLVVIEAFSLGLPVIGARIGTVGTLIQPLETGLLYSSGDPQALSSALAQYATDADAEQAMRRGARAYYLANHTPARNYERLLEIYHAVM